MMLLSDVFIPLFICFVFTGIKKVVHFDSFPIDTISIIFMLRACYSTIQNAQQNRNRAYNLQEDLSEMTRQRDVEKRRRVKAEEERDVEREARAEVTRELRVIVRDLSADSDARAMADREHTNLLRELEAQHKDRARTQRILEIIDKAIELAYAVSQADGNCGIDSRNEEESEGMFDRAFYPDRYPHC